MPTARLPSVGSDVNNWGTLLSDYLTKTVGQVPGTGHVFYLDAYGADPTGAALSDSAWTACYADATAALQTHAGSLIVIGAGWYKFSVNTVAITDSRIGLRGAGRLATSIWTAGNTGVLVSIRDSGSGEQSAPISGFTVYGWSGGNSLTGIEYGSRPNGSLTDVAATGFNGTSGRGFWFHDTSVNLSEGSYVQAHANQNTINYDFDGSSGASSFDYSSFFLHVVSTTAGGNSSVALRMINAMQIYGGYIHLCGNASATVGLTTTVIQIGASTSDTSRIQATQLNVNVECDSSAGTVKDFLVQGGANTGIIQCNGIMSFLNTASNYTIGSVGGSSVITCSGYLLGPLFSGHGTLTPIGTGGSFMTYSG